MNENDAKTLRRLRRERKVADMREGRRERSEVFGSVSDYQRKGKYGNNWLAKAEEEFGDG